jgi:predicted ferric reductase
MKAIKRSLVVLILGLSLLWLWADAPAWYAMQGVFAWRNEMLQFTGVLGIGVMSVAMLLAIRPVVLERRLHGLDKMYRLHKWLGITGLVVSIAHWLWVEAPKWLVEAGWIERAVRGPRPEPGDDFAGFLQSQRGLAEGVGEWAFYASLVLIAIALVKYFPYRYFFKTHRWMAVAYLALVLHSIVLMRFTYWSTPLGVVMASLMVCGTVAAVISLFRRIGIRRKAVGVVGTLETLDGVGVSAVTVHLKSDWPGHEAGQFAFVSFDAREGAHPFTISSDWKGDGRLQFLIKALGDYTRTLSGTLKPGSVVEVEGPYGRFNFEGTSQRQIWIGGGIGITPFVARMKALAAQPDGRNVDLFHTTTEVDQVALQKLREDARNAGVRLHIMVDARDGLLTGDRLCKEVPDWRTADVWFCGPTAFGNAIRHALVVQGLPAMNFHQELFAMR